MNLFDRFSEDSKKILSVAQEYADTMKTSLTSEHLLLALVQENEKISNLLVSQGLGFDKIHLSVGLGKFLRNPDSENITIDAKKILEKSFSIAHKKKNNEIVPDNIFKAILNSKNSRAYKILIENGADITSLKNQIDNKKTSKNFLDDDFLNDIFGSEGFENIFEKTGLLSKPKTSNYVKNFAVDLTQKAIEGKLDPLIGRKKELQRMIVILNRRSKNNPVLVGDPGIGKTAIVEGLAQKIARGNVPANLLGKKIYSLDLAGMISGTKYRGEFEERLTQALKSLKKDPNAILFVDEIHNIVGAGSAEGSMDAANILKPALARGEIKIIGATTFDDYRKYIEKDSALERRMAKVVISEPNENETFEILKGLRKKYESHHKVKISENVLKEIVKLSKRYISDRFLPDKAIDVLDESAAEKSVNFNAPTKNKELLKKKLMILEKRKNSAVMSQEFEEAAKIRDRQKALKRKLLTFSDSTNNQENVLSIADVAKVVSNTTGIPLGEIVYNEAEKLSNLEYILKQNIKGQEAAIKEIASTIRRARTGVSSSKKPLGSFIFLGPTGVGKTELAKIIAERIFQNPNALVKIDMSELSEKHNVSRLVGAPPGYVGYEDAGKLTETVRQNPYSVVLLDEIEKAHPDIQNILLQVLEDGYLTDAKGRRVNFTNTIVILTSNIGLKEFRNAAKIGFSEKSKKDILKEFDEYQNKISKELRNFFRPEFLNRIDKIIFFKPLTKNILRQITKLQINELAKRLEEKNIKLEVRNKVFDLIMKKGYDPENGARPIRRAVQDILEEPISEFLINPKNKKIKKILVEARKKKVKVIGNK